MKRETITKIYLKLRKYFEEHKDQYPTMGVSFGYEDRPIITYNNEVRKVTDISLSGKDSIHAVLSPYWHSTIIRTADIDAIELYNLLKRVYNETDAFMEYGEFDDWCFGEFGKIVERYCVIKK